MQFLYDRYIAAKKTIKIMKMTSASRTLVISFMPLVLLSLNLDNSNIVGETALRGPR